MSLPRPTDYGDFVLQTALNDDLKMLRMSLEKARENPDKPGHHWTRLVVKQQTPLGPVEMIKLYHVDLNEGVIEISETRNAVPTAYRIFDAADIG